MFTKSSCQILNIIRTSVIKRSFSKKDDYYSILGVPKSATQSEIKKAFAKLAREYHPDKNSAPDAKDKFSKISEAYSTLSDEKKRDVYNQTGMGGDEQKQYQNSGFDPSGADFDFSDFFRGAGGGQQGGFEDVFREFGDMFGGGGRSNRPSKGADIIISLNLNFFEAVAGSSKEVSFRVQDVCGTCKGNKCKPGTNPEKCFNCSGSGMQTMRQGNFHVQIPCQSCQGQGIRIKSPCQTCKGSGIAGKLLKETLNIPKGVNTGQSLRISGKGNKGERGGSSGDLIVKINVTPDNYFKREGFDIYTELSISIGQAVLGGIAEVRCLNGNRNINIPAGTASGKKIRLPNEGITKLPPNHTQKGDHYVILNIRIPNKLSEKEKKIFEELKEIEMEKGGSVKQSNPQANKSKDEQSNQGFFKNMFNGGK